MLFRELTQAGDARLWSSNGSSQEGLRCGRPIGYRIVVLSPVCSMKLTHDIETSRSNRPVAICAGTPGMAYV